MKIKFKGTFKSISTFETDELSDFCIITGKNGVGKTQLLQATNLKHLPPNTGMTQQQAALIQQYSIDFIPRIVKAQFEGIILSSSNIVALDNWRGKVALLADPFFPLHAKAKEFISLLVNDAALFEKLKSGIIVVGKDEALFDTLGFNWEELAREWNNGHASASHLPTIEQRISQSRSFVIQQCISLKKIISFVGIVAAYQRKPVLTLVRSDFYNTPLDETILENADLFNIQIEALFYNYAKTRAQNDYLYYRKISHGVENSSTPDSEFITHQPPPWKVINEILADHKIKYSVKGIEFDEFSEGLQYEFHLIKKDNKKAVKFHDLSTGEQIIIGLILKLFLAGTYADRIELPNYIFLDEPDAHLHPEMSKLLLDVLYKTFVSKLGIHVIITTHDPSTIALAPDGCIYEMQNEPQTLLKKISKDDALQILTQNLPLLSIDYKNHKQIFVESPTDVDFYQTIFNKYAYDEMLHFKLYFIATSAGKANCDEVKRLVKQLRQSGNDKAYGLIDWDRSNRSSEDPFTIVHGEGLRYSIENYLLDPLYLAALFLDQGKNSNGMEQELNFQAPYNQFSVGNEPAGRLQEIANWVINKVKDKYFNYVKDSSSIEVEYLNGKKIKLPKWYLETQGHELAEKVIGTFKSINYLKEADLIPKLIQVMGKCYPLIPLESIEVMKILGNPDLYTSHGSRNGRTTSTR
jgi:energy-coupling factor transporter ATP-binding protein EcfA2